MIDLAALKYVCHSFRLSVATAAATVLLMGAILAFIRIQDGNGYAEVQDKLKGAQSSSHSAEQRINVLLAQASIAETDRMEAVTFGVGMLSMTAVVLVTAIGMILNAESRPRNVSSPRTKCARALLSRDSMMARKGEALS
jgi:succinate dehydrogenase hydrophobic anchor subunit